MSQQNTFASLFARFHFCYFTQLLSLHLLSIYLKLNARMFLLLTQKSHAAASHTTWQKNLSLFAKAKQTHNNWANERIHLVGWREHRNFVYVQPKNRGKSQNHSTSIQFRRVIQSVRLVRFLLSSFRLSHKHNLKIPI